MSDTPPPPGRPDEPENPYGAPPPPPYGTPPQPYSYGFGGPVQHSGATTSLVLGICSIAAAVIGTCLCFFLGALGAAVGPFGIWQGLRSRREIDANPAAYSNRGNAVAGLVCSIIGTVLGALVLLASLALLVIVGFGAAQTPGY